jgi:hypothetical protein
LSSEGIKDMKKRIYAIKEVFAEDLYQWDVPNDEDEKERFLFIVKMAKENA